MTIESFIQKWWINKLNWKVKEKEKIRSNIVIEAKDNAKLEEEKANGKDQLVSEVKPKQTEEQKLPSYPYAKINEFFKWNTGIKDSAVTQAHYGYPSIAAETDLRMSLERVLLVEYTPLYPL